MWGAARALTCAGAISLLLVAAVSTQPRARGYLPLSDVRPLLAAPAAPIPSDLPVLTGPQANSRWLSWIATHDRNIRQRLREGDEDTLVNWLLLGRSFTSLAPVTVYSGASEAAVASATGLIRARVDALVLALESPGGDERRQFARSYLESRGIRFGGRERVHLHRK